MGAFWYFCIPFRVKVIVSQCFDYESAISGFSSLVRLDSENEALTSVVIYYPRRLLAGKTC